MDAVIYVLLVVMAVMLALVSVLGTAFLAFELYLYIRDHRSDPWG